MSSSDLTTQDAPRPTDLATLANEINDLHDRATEAARTAIAHARECGELLIQAKAQVGHGGFLEWLEAPKNLRLLNLPTHFGRRLEPLSDRTAERIVATLASNPEFRTALRHLLRESAA